MKIVNGFVCECQDDARLAKRGIDPDNPHNDPLKQRELEEKRGQVKVEPVEETQASVLDPKRLDESADAGAVQFGGALATLQLDEKPGDRSEEQLVDILA